MASLTKITFHHTGGVYTPNQTDLNAYHFLIDGDGKVIKGKYKPEDNINCKDGVYARHCGGMNTGNIGIAICVYEWYICKVWRICAILQCRHIEGIKCVPSCLHTTGINSCAEADDVTLVLTYDLIPHTGCHCHQHGNTCQ